MAKFKPGSVEYRPSERRKNMKRIAIRGKVFILIFILLLVSGCSYNMENIQPPHDIGVGCAKPLSDWTQYDRQFCGP